MGRRAIRGAHEMPRKRTRPFDPNGTDGFERLSVHPNRLVWPPHFVKLLGVVTDEELARRAGISAGAVTAERKRRKITAFAARRPPIEWTDEMVALLGTCSDRALAAELGFSHGVIFTKRKRLGIAAHTPPPYERIGHVWKTWELALLGEHSDRVVARKLGISAATVAVKRHDTGTASCEPAPVRVRWSKKWIALLGRIADVDLAERLGTDKGTVKRKRDELGVGPHSVKSRAVANTPGLVQILSRSSREVMAKGKISKQTVYKLRKAYGVSAPDPRSWRWTPEWLSRLGVWPDRRIAQALGVTVGAVSYQRRRQGIPAVVRRLRPWTAKELALVGKLPDATVVKRTGRTLQAVAFKRRALMREGRDGSTD